MPWWKDNKPHTILDIWNSCNLRCSFCYHDYAREKKDFFKSYKYIKEQINDIAERSNFVVILWWETLLHPDIWKIMDDFREKDVYVSITTTWYLFTNKKLLRKLLGYSNLSSLTISIHTIFEEDGKGIYWKEWVVWEILKWLDNLMEIKDEYNKDLFLANSITWNYDNYKNLWKTIRYLYEKWLNIIQLSTIHAYKWYWFSQKNYNALAPYIFLKKTFEEVDDLLEDGLIFIIKSMPLCLHRFLIKYDYWIKEFVHGDTHETRLDDHWNSVWENQNYTKLKLDKCEGCYAYWKYCYGSYKFYDKKFGDKEFKTLTKKDVTDLKYKKFTTLKKYFKDKWREDNLERIKAQKWMNL